MVRVYENLPHRDSHCDRHRRGCCGFHRPRLPLRRDVLRRIGSLGDVSLHRLCDRADDFSGAHALDSHGCLQGHSCGTYRIHRLECASREGAGCSGKGNGPISTRWSGFSIRARTLQGEAAFKRNFKPLGRLDDLEAQLDKGTISLLIVEEGSVSRSRLHEIAEASARSIVSLKVIPTAFDIWATKLSSPGRRGHPAPRRL